MCRETLHDPIDRNQQRNFRQRDLALGVDQTKVSEGGVVLSGIRKSFGSLDIIHGINLLIPWMRPASPLKATACGRKRLHPT